jgi:hypothetical protein
MCGQEWIQGRDEEGQEDRDEEGEGRRGQVADAKGRNDTSDLPCCWNFFCRGDSPKLASNGSPCSLGTPT